MSQPEGGAAPLRKTPLHDRHVALGARMVPFAGFEMPVQYTGVIEEHRAVRTAAGLFDVSHMGEFRLRGKDAVRFADFLVPTSVAKLEPGRVAYSGLLTEKGTFVDDVLVYRIAENEVLFVVNAANLEKDRDWFLAHKEGFDVEFVDESDETALVALQGPRSKEILAGLAEGFDAKAQKYYRWATGKVAGRPAMASRTGYTGEIGFEIFLAPGDAAAVWDALLEAGKDLGLLPAGLGARDTLRLEAAMPLYGNDIDETTTPLEADLEFIVHWDKESFLGKEALVAQREAGVPRKRVGFEVRGRGIARHGHPVWLDGERVSEVTSGTMAPFLGKAIGMTYLPARRAEPGVEIEIEVRGRRLPAVTVPLPFYRRPKKRARRNQDGGAA